MNIKVLVENTNKDENYIAEHGLSLYIETSKHKILSDTGASDAFIKNADILGVDLTKADTLILSHGHYDHSGGILSFNKINPAAKIYIRKTALSDFYHGERYIGIDKAIAKLANVIYLDKDTYNIDDELSVFSNVTGRRYFANGNYELKKLENGRLVQDEFDHEQYLVIKDDNKNILISGCAHNGILNIIDKYRDLYGSDPDVVISGFHMMKKTDYTEDEILNIKNTAFELSKMNTVFYTGHCTGLAAIDIMKPIMGDKLIRLYSGKEISL